MTFDSQSDLTVPTVRGDIPLASLGRTLMHEHTFVKSPEINDNYPETWGDDDQRVSDAIRQYQKLKARGVDTVVDCTVIGLGRYIPRVQRVAAEVDLNIIVATGIYVLSELPYYFSIRGPGTMTGGPEYMTDWFVRDILEGIADTGVRAGIIKVATHEKGLTPDVTRGLRAVAGAHRQTGVPITTHTYCPPNGLEQQRVFKEEGVDLSRVVIGHVGHSVHDLDYIRELISNGSFVGFDQFWPPNLELLLMPSLSPGSEDYRTALHMAQERANTALEAIVTLVNEGHVDRIVLSNDHLCGHDDFAPHEFSGGFDKTYLLEAVLPGLRERGLSEAQIDTMLVDNPRQVFATTTQGPY